MNANQNKLIEIAKSLIGTPYKYAAKPEEVPNYFDCSSFTQYVYKQIGIEIPRSTILQATQGKEIKLPITNYQLLIPGDLLFFRGSKGHYNDLLFPNQEIYIGHVAMYLGDNKIIHANSKQDKIIVQPLENLKMPVVIIKRIL